MQIRPRVTELINLARDYIGILLLEIKQVPVFVTLSSQPAEKNRRHCLYGRQSVRFASRARHVRCAVARVTSVREEEKETEQVRRDEIGR